MIIKQLTLATLDTGTLDFGFVGENEHIKFVIKCDSVFDEYPTATASLLIKAPDNTIYPKTVEVEGNNVGWVITASDTAYPGSGQIQLTFAEDGAVVKTVIANTNVKDSLVGDDPPPDPIADWISTANQILGKVEGMTATAESLPSGDDPSVTVETVDGHYNLEFGIPAGDPGDPTEIIDDNAGVGDVTKVWSANKSATELSELKSEIDRKAPCIYQDASGDVVTVTDGADGMPLSACTVQVNPVQSGTGDPSPENIRPITGRTASNIVRARKNLFCLSDYIAAGWEKVTDSDPDLQDVYRGNKHAFYHLHGDAGSNEGTGLLGKLMPLGRVTISFYKYTENSDRVYFHYVGETWVNHSGNITTVGQKSFTSDANKICDGVALDTIQGSTATAKIGQLQIEIGSEATAYESPVTTRFPITFPDSAGTVYGGTVDLEAQTLTVTHGSVTLATASRVNYKLNNTIPLVEILFPTDRRANASTQSYFKTSMYGMTTGAEDKKVRGYATEIDVYDTSFTDQQTAEAILSDFICVYKLAEPLVYSLSDLPTITTLPGYNAIWSDTGAVVLTYPADTKTYVDDSIPSVPVQDVQINGTSILSDGVANVPIASLTTLGVAKPAGMGINVNASGEILLSTASSAHIKAGTNNFIALTPGRQNEAVFYGLAKLAGADMASSSNPVGTYTDAAKDKIMKMIGILDMIAPYESTGVATRAYGVGDCFIQGGHLYRATASISIGVSFSASNCEQTTLMAEITR